MTHNTDLSPRHWSIYKYHQFVSEFRRKYPNYKIVQIGVCPREDIIDLGADVILINKTTFEDLTVILFHSKLHIDGDGGMVHLRMAMGGLKSVVLFGQTPASVFAHPSNVNIISNKCKPCAFLFESGDRSCKLYETPICMDSIEVSTVINHIMKILR